VPSCLFSWLLTEIQAVSHRSRIPAGGCQGATPDILFEYAMSKGFVLEDDYPYVSGNGTEPSCALKAKEVRGLFKNACPRWTGGR
jgi:hypothetical protein